MDDRELSPPLREAYREARETAEPSELLWRRTRRALRERGLLRNRGRRPLGGSTRARLVAVAAGAALAGFLLGLAAGRSVEPRAVPSTAALPEDPTAAVERVQRVGTDYARALGALTRSLDRGTGVQVARGQQVLMALTGAHSELIRGLAPTGLGATDDGPARAPMTEEGADASGHAGETPLIWF